MTFKNKRVLVVGLAKSGLAAAQLLRRHGADVAIVDEKPRRELGAVLKDIPKGTRLLLGTKRIPFSGFDLLVTSPGVPWDHKDLVAARKAGIAVWPELELAWRFVNPKKTVAITGTNGKTTTTALIGHLLKSAKRPVVIGGNIGTPLSTLASTVSSKTYLVLEVSSYQLEGHQTFHPNVGAFLNLTPDHLKRHGTMAGYAKAKGRLFDLFRGDDTAVLNGRDAWCRKVGKGIRSRKIWFPNKTDRAFARYLQLPGEHNQENAMAAAAVVRTLGVSSADIKRGMRSFRGVAHRIETVRSLRGVTWVNDSKSTNVDSTSVALKSFKGPIVLILGGQHKGSPYTPLRSLIKGRVRTILTVGEAAPIVAKDLKGTAEIVACGTIEKAVRWASKATKYGDVVLLSPACASFDQFKNFEHRGDVFAKAVRSLR